MKKLMFFIVLFILIIGNIFADEVITQPMGHPGGMRMYNYDRYFLPEFSISYPLISNEMTISSTNYSAKKSWSFMLESNLTRNDFINLGIGVMYTEQFRLATLSSYTTYSTPDTYKFVPIYMIVDMGLSPSTAFVFKVGAGNVSANNEFITEFGDINSIGYYYAGGIRFLSTEILYSIDSLTLSTGGKIKNTKISFVF
ncbi:MAG: hypothetical protein PWP46_1497 [Fusobacteriaceae bacterium]|jgi:hypothetical protein|nr:hypothetical protein [Fusobacteriaceae bacterium]